MSYTLAGLIERVKAELQDQEYSEATITTYLNSVQFEVLGEDKYPFMEKVDKLTDTRNGSLDLPMDYQKTIGFYARPEGKNKVRRALKYITPDEYFDHTSGRYWVYTSYGGKLLYNLPKYTPDEKDADCEDCGSDYDMTHLYLAKPTALVKSTDVPAIPEEFGEILILGAVARAERARGNFDFADMYENNKIRIESNMKLRYGLGEIGTAIQSKLPLYSVMGGDHGDF